MPLILETVDTYNWDLFFKILGYSLLLFLLIGFIIVGVIVAILVIGLYLKSKQENKISKLLEKNKKLKKKIKNTDLYILLGCTLVGAIINFIFIPIDLIRFVGFYVLYFLIRMIPFAIIYLIIVNIYLHIEIKKLNNKK